MRQTLFSFPNIAPSSEYAAFICSSHQFIISSFSLLRESRFILLYGLLNHPSTHSYFGMVLEEPRKNSTVYKKADMDNCILEFSCQLESSIQSRVGTSLQRGPHNISHLYTESNIIQTMVPMLAA